MKSRIKDALGLPKGVGYCVPMPRELLESPALAVLPLRSRRTLDGLMVAYAGEGGKANGSFRAPYDAIVAQGVRRDVVLDALVDLHAVGLIGVTRGARSFGTRQAPSTYRLTWLGTPDGLGPTNEWRSSKTIEEAETRIANARERLEAERLAKRQRRVSRSRAPEESANAAA